jgi:hypothetical protein
MIDEVRAAGQPVAAAAPIDQRHIDASHHARARRELVPPAGRRDRPTRSHRQPPRARPPRAVADSAAFGYTSSGGYLTVNTGAGLSFKINESDRDMTSLVYNGVQLQSQDGWSHVESGLGTNTMTIHVISGSAGLGDYLRPGFSYDRVEMY